MSRKMVTGATERLAHRSSVCLAQERSVKPQAKRVILQTKVSHATKHPIGFAALHSTSELLLHAIPATKTHTQLRIGSMGGKLTPHAMRIQKRIHLQPPNPPRESWRSGDLSGQAYVHGVADGARNLQGSELQ
jgi:hypothetical protein